VNPKDVSGSLMEPGDGDEIHAGFHAFEGRPETFVDLEHGGRRSVGLPRRVLPLPEGRSDYAYGLDDGLAHISIGRIEGGYAPWHFLNFLPLPHQQGSLRPIFSFGLVRTGCAAAAATAPGPAVLTPPLSAASITWAPADVSCS
jgi:hypothetical protein